MTEEQRSFTVKDRRHFTPDGRAREPEEGTAAESGPPEAQAVTQAAAERTPGESAPRAEPAAPDADSRRAAPDSVDFAQFLMSMGAQASLLLSGEMEGVDAAQALAQARSLIGILEMLKHKTEGRREPREDQVIEGLLYELRMAYVERAREVGE